MVLLVDEILLFIWPTQMMHADHAVQRLQKQVDELKESATGTTFESAPLIPPLTFNIRIFPLFQQWHVQETSGGTFSSFAQV